MVADTRKMYELKLKIKKILEEEFLSDAFNGAVAGGMVTEIKAEEFIEKFSCSQKRNEIFKLTKEEIMDNPYLQEIKIPNIQQDNILLCNRRIIKKNTLGLYKESVRDISTFQVTNSYFQCDSTLRFPAIIEGDTKVCWMSVEPSETLSFQNFINDAYGNVLLFGCGLGYVAYMLSIKEEVKSITIVELNSDIIKMFSTYILPQFKNKEKIRIVKMDALETFEMQTNLREHQNSEAQILFSNYDFINVDIWRDTLDMLPIYLMCLKVEKEYPNVKFSYWLENDLKVLMQKEILMRFCNLKDDNFLLASRIGQDLVENSVIQTESDLKELVRLSNMRSNLLEWFLHHEETFCELKEKDERKMQKIVNEEMSLSRKI